MPRSKLTIAEQIANAKADIKQSGNRLKLLNQKQREQERKDRTKRLIERGAILESLIDGAADLDNEQIHMLVERIGIKERMAISVSSTLRPF